MVSLSPVVDRSRIVQLDGLRGLAIALVLIWHDVFGLVQTTPGSAGAYAMRALSLTWAGVDLFFVLSGFLIGGILLDNRDSARFFSTFYARRACRIFPLYYTVLALFLFSAAALRGPDTAEWQRWIFDNALPGWAYALFVQNFAMVGSGMGPNGIAVTWSLAVEEQFYLIAPLLVWLLPRRTLTCVLVFLIVATPAVRIAFHLWVADPGMASYVLLPARWDALFLGTLAAVVWRQPQALDRLRRATPVIASLVVAGFATLAGLMVANQNIGSRAMAAGGYTVIALCGLGIIVLTLLAEERFLHRWFRLRPLVWLGTISYGVYLFHRPVTGVTHGLLLGTPPRIDSWTSAAVTLLALLCTLLLAEISARVFERPIVDFGRRHARY